MTLAQLWRRIETYCVHFVIDPIVADLTPADEQLIAECRSIVNSSRRTDDMTRFVFDDENRIREQRCAIYILKRGTKQMRIVAHDIFAAREEAARLGFPGPHNWAVVPWRPETHRAMADVECEGK